MNKYILIPGIMFFLIMFGCQDQNTTNTELFEFSGITQTDMYGNVIGSPDTNDWTSDKNPYANTYIGKSITVWRTGVRINCFEVESTYSDILIITNISDELVQINSSIESPFLCSPVQTTLSTNEMCTLNVSLTPHDTTTVSGTLSVYSSVEDTVQIPAIGGVNLAILIENYPIHYTFYPAYPNPASNRILFIFAITSHNVHDVYLRVVNTDESITKTLVNDTMNFGIKRIQWDLKDDSGNRVAPGIYRTMIEINQNQTRFSGEGDIQIVE